MSTHKEDVQSMRKGHSLAQRLLNARTEPTDDQVRTLGAALDASQRVKGRLRQAAEDADLRSQLAVALRPDVTAPRDGKTGRWSAKAAAQMLTSQIDAKAIAPSGSVVSPVGLVVQDPIPLGAPARSLLAAVPQQVVDSPPNVEFIRQVTRENNAAIVASGATKPTSVYTFQRVDGTLSVIAHLSEQIDKFWLSDNESLRLFIETELRDGLETAVEAAILNGTGAPFTGLLNTSGIQTQAFDTDGHVTLRKALTKVQAAGGETIVTAVHPADYEAMSLLRATTNEFIATGANVYNDPKGSTAPPYGPTAYSTWGTPLVVSNALPAGTAVMFDQNATRLFTDAVTGVEWNTSIHFASNGLVARFEGRYAMGVLKPLQVVSVDMAA